MKKIKLSDKQKKDLKYYIIIFIVIDIVIEILKYFNQFNLTSFIVGELCFSFITALRKKLYK